MDMNTKEHFIKLFRANGFTCIPIPKYADSVKEQKAADYRIKNRIDQPISEDENYAVIPTENAGTCCLDFDHKELFREFAEENIKNGVMVIESPNGWHIPIKGLVGEMKKVFLYQNMKNQGKPVIEILTHKQYVVGCGSDVYNHKKGQRDYYRNVGSEKIWDARGKFFEDFVDFIASKLKLVFASNVTLDHKGHYELRRRFKKGLPPVAGTSNDYWFDAGVVVHSDDLPYEEGIKKVREVYDKWENKTRAWSNIEAKVKSAYEGKKIDSKGGRKKKEDKENDSVILCQNMIKERSIYSDIDTDQIFENKSGYLENITNLLHKELQHEYPELTKDLFNEIKFRLVGLADDLPPTNDDFKVFDNGIWDEKQKLLLSKDTKEIASMGFKGYNYLDDSPENLPKKYMKLLFDNVPKNEHPRIKAALKSALSPRLDSRMSVIHGRSRVGKSAALTILFSTLNKNSEYAMTVELSQMEDHFIKAKIIGKTLVILSELPKTIRDWAGLKSLTGETRKTERGFHQDAETFTNMIKIIATTNNIPKIPEEERNAFYSARLSLIHNTRIDPYDPIEDFERDIVESEGEKIISWIINLPKEECVYEDRDTVTREWEGLASPEFDFLENNYEIKTTIDDSAVAVMRLKREFNEIYPQVTMTLKQMTETLETMGYVVRKNIVLNIQDKPIPEQVSGQKRMM